MKGEDARSHRQELGLPPALYIKLNRDPPPPRILCSGGLIAPQETRTLAPVLLDLLHRCTSHTSPSLHHLHNTELYIYSAPVGKEQPSICCLSCVVFHVLSFICCLPYVIFYMLSFKCCLLYIAFHMLSFICCLLYVAFHMLSFMLSFMCCLFCPNLPEAVLSNIPFWGNGLRQEFSNCCICTPWAVEVVRGTVVYNTQRNE